MAKSWQNVYVETCLFKLTQNLTISDDNTTDIQVRNLIADVQAVACINSCHERGLCVEGICNCSQGNVNFATIICSLFFFSFLHQVCFKTRFRLLKNGMERLLHSIFKTQCN